MSKNTEGVNVLTQSLSSIELSRGQNGKYSWKVKVYGESTEDIINRVAQVNMKLLLEYGEKDKKPELT